MRLAEKQRRHISGSRDANDTAPRQQVCEPGAIFRCADETRGLKLSLLLAKESERIFLGQPFHEAVAEHVREFELFILTGKKAASESPIFADCQLTLAGQDLFECVIILEKCDFGDAADRC